MAKPANMKQSTWEYLLKFTSNHEGVVLHMYNNKRAAGENNDVTCGIGFANMPNKESSLQYLDMFYDKDTGQPATREQLMKDWETAANLLRTPGNLESTPDGQGYADKCQLRMWPEKVQGKKEEILNQKLTSSLLVSDLWNFWDYPAVAQVACASFFYGWAAQQAPLMCKALQAFDFDEAGKQSYLTGLSPEKLLAHRVLFWNAARIYEQNLDNGWLPQKTKPPELLPWKPWTRNVYDLDSNTSDVERHDVAPSQPSATK
jgi:hypothetical protein